MLAVRLHTKSTMKDCLGDEMFGGGVKAGRNGRLGIWSSVATVGLAAFFLTADSISGVTDVMTQSAYFSVTQTGAATYNIPIAVPPGTAGMAPSLSLEYTSQGGNGLLRMGWTLGGLPSIGRCPRTVAQDGALGDVNFDANDRFCMDGQRLVLISGTYGVDGAQYRTEVESFSKITSHGTAGNGPAWFEVHTKSGQTMEFGNSADSRVLAQGKATARSWAISKVSDTKGNYFTVSYTNDETNGQAYPVEVDYTGIRRPTSALITRSSSSTRRVLTSRHSTRLVRSLGRPCASPTL